MARKRRHGEGSIVKLPNGRFQVRVSYWEGGRLRRVARYAKTAAEAARVLSELRRQAPTQAGPGLGPERGRLTVAAFADVFLAAIRDQVRPRTWERYESLLRMHILPHLGRLRLRDLHPAQVQRWLTTLAQPDRGLSARSVEQAHAVLRRMLTLAERWGYREGNPARLVPPPRPHRPEVQPFTPAELAAILAALTEPAGTGAEAGTGAGTGAEAGTEGAGVEAALAALVLVAAGTGLRQSELLGLRWRDVDLSAGRLTVRGQLQWGSGRFGHVPPKSARGRRTLSLPQSVVAALTDQRRRWEAWAALPTWDPLPDPDLFDLVFPTPTGRPQHAASLIHRWQRALARAGVPYRPFHTLRHTAATWMLAAGVDLRTVQGVLGHAQIGLTANLYAHLTPSLLEDAARRLDGWLPAPPAPPSPAEGER
jgi:integrase